MNNVIEFIIEGELVDLNHYIRVERSNRFGAAAMKQAMTSLVAQHAHYKKLGKMHAPFYVNCHWYCKNKKKDPDNIAFAKKFILDGLKEAGVITSDGWEQVIAFNDFFSVDSKNPRVVVGLVYGGE